MDSYKPLFEHREHSLAGKKTDSELLPALEAYRENKDDKAAVDELTFGLMGYAYEQADGFFVPNGRGESRKLPVDEVIGACTEGIYEALRRLRENGRSDIVRYVQDELGRIRREYWREEVFGSHVPYSTNSTRRRKGQKPHESLIPNCFTDLEQEEEGDLDRAFSPDEIADKTDHTADVAFSELIEYLADTIEDKQVLNLLSHDLPKTKIQLQCNISSYSLEKVIDRAYLRHPSRADYQTGNVTIDNPASQCASEVQPRRPTYRHAVRVPEDYFVSA